MNSDAAALSRRKRSASRAMNVHAPASSSLVSRGTARPALLRWRALRTLLGLALAPLALSAQIPHDEAGMLPSRHYSPRDYGGHQRNHAVTSDAQGILYFGN